MFPGIGRQDLRNVAFAKMTPELAAIEMAAHGGAVIEVRRDGGKWSVVPNSKYARRIDASTPMEITGPAAGHARLQTKDDPTGKRVLGMLNNCAGGVTPWGTWLTCEENFQRLFLRQAGRAARGSAQPQALRRSRQLDELGQIHRPLQRSPRSRTSQIVSAGSSRSIRSIRPPRRRSALRSAAPSTRAQPGSSTRTDATSSIPATTSASTMSIASSRTARVDTANPKANADILDSGTLSVARYDADGTLTWLPLVFGEGPLSRLRTASTARRTC